MKRSLGPLFAGPSAAVLLGILLLSTPAVAVAASPPTPATISVNTPAATGAPPVLLADGEWWTWKSIYKTIESCLNSRAGLLRVGTIGMVIALVIIMFNNKWK